MNTLSLPLSLTRVCSRSEQGGHEVPEGATRGPLAGLAGGPEFPDKAQLHASPLASLREHPREGVCDLWHATPRTGQPTYGLVRE
jgi:hypothetical protein